MGSRRDRWKNEIDSNTDSRRNRWTVGISSGSGSRRNRWQTGEETPIESREPSTATGMRPWYQNLIINVVSPAMKTLQFLNTFSVWGSQTRAAIQRNVEGLRGDRARQLYLPEYTSFEQTMESQYRNQEDPGLAMSQFAGVGTWNPLAEIERGLRGPETSENQFITSGRASVPDTYEQSYEIIKNFADKIKFTGKGLALEPNPETGLLEMKEVPVTVGIPEWLQGVGAGLWNEQTIAQIESDPLVIWEAFNVGRKVLGALEVGVDTVNRPVGAWRRAQGVLENIAPKERTWNQAARVRANRVLSSTAEMAHQVSGLAWRRVYRAARFPGAEAEYKLANRARLNFTQQETLRKVSGQTPEQFEKLVGRITEITEAAPGGFRSPFEQMGEMMAGTRTGELAPGGIRPGTPQHELLRDDLLAMVKGEFNDIPLEGQEQITDKLIDNWVKSGYYPEASRILGLPAANLVGDKGYMMRILTQKAHEARWASMSPEMQKIYNMNIANMPGDNMLGDALSTEARKRNLRGLISFYNEESAAGRVGYTNGKLNILKEGTAVPEGFVPVDKLLVDNPFQLATARYARHVQAHSAQSFFKDVSSNPAFLTRQGIEGGISVKELIEHRHGWGKGEYDRTFAYLGDDMRELAEKVKFRDVDTAVGVVNYLRVLQDFKNLPSPRWAMYDRILGYWRGLTLTPFMSYHTRNKLGDLNNSLMARGDKGEVIADFFDQLDSMYPTVNRRRIGTGEVPKWFNEYKELGLDVHGQTAVEWAGAEDVAHVRPLDDTPLASGWSLNPVADNFGGKEIGMAIENQGRFATFIGARRRGYSAKKAATFVYKYHFDYADVPSWFQHGTAARRAAAFPIWTMKNIPIQLEHMITTPTWFAMRGRVINQMRQGSPAEPGPKWATEKGAVQTPGGAWIVPENFDPAYSPFEILDPAEFVWQLLNPFVAEPLQQIVGTAERQNYGAPSTTVPTAPGYGEWTGYDQFRKQPIVRPTREWNELLGGGKMPAWAQRGDHLLRGFIRFYSEASTAIKEAQKESAGESPYEEGEFIGKKLGVPIFKFKPEQTIYFAVRDNDIEIGRVYESIHDNDNVVTPENFATLKNLYEKKIAYLSHGTFMEINPWDGEPRPWLDIANEGEYVIRGKQMLFRDLMNTFNLLLYGREGYGTKQKHPPIPLDASEIASAQEMMASLLDSYMTIMYGAEYAEEDINYKSEENWLENRTPVMMGLSQQENQ